MATTFDPHDNLATSLVATAPSPANSGTSLTVTATEGARFPASAFNATIYPDGEVPTPANSEIVRVTDVTGDALTITRAQESTSARTVLVGDRITLTVTEKALTDIEGALNTAETDIDTVEATLATHGDIVTSDAADFATAGHVHDAVDVTYGPTTESDWTDPDPTTVEGALDTLAGEKITAATTDTLTNKTVNDFSNFVGADEVRVEARNVSGSTIDAGTPIYISGYNVGVELIEIEPADATSAATMPCVAIAETDIANGTSGSVVAIGGVLDIDTSSFTAGDRLYVDTTAGTFTTTPPASNIQEVAFVLRSHATLGAIAANVQGVEADADAYTPAATGDWAAANQPTGQNDALDILADRSTAAVHVLTYNDVDDYEPLNGAEIPPGAPRRFIGDTDPASAGGGSWSLVANVDEWLDTTA